MFRTQVRFWYNEWLPVPHEALIKTRFKQDDGAGSNSDADVDSDIAKKSDLLEELKFPVEVAPSVWKY